MKNVSSLFKPLPVILAVILLFMAASCATVRLDPSNRAEQVSVTFDKTIK